MTAQIKVKEPVFHADWFSHNVPHIEKYLSHLKGKPYVEGLEIGCWEGRSSLWFLLNILTGTGANLTCVDSFQGNPENKLEGYERDVEDIFVENMRLAGVSDRVHLKRQISNVALKFLHTANFDFIYVDGSHNPKDVLTDLVLSWLLLKSGGIMIMDDYQFCDPRVGSEPKPAIDAFYNIFKKDLIVLHTDWQVIWRKI